MGSSSRVFCAPRMTGSMRFSVPGPRGESPLSGLPGSSWTSGRPVSRRRRPPRSKTRKGLPVCPSSQRGKGNSDASQPFSIVSCAVGAGTVLIRRGAPVTGS